MLKKIIIEFKVAKQFRVEKKLCHATVGLCLVIIPLSSLCYSCLANTAD